MNFLQPKKMAEVATAVRIECLKETIAAQKVAASKATAEVGEKAEMLGNVTLLLSAKASEKGTLFKALGEKEVMAALKKQAGVEVKKTDIEMEHLKKVGDHTVVVKLGKDKIEVKVKLEAKEGK